MTQQGEILEGEDNQVFPDSFTKVHEFVQNNVQKKFPDSCENILYLSGYWEGVQNYTFEIIIKTVREHVGIL